MGWDEKFLVPKHLNVEFLISAALILGDFQVIFQPLDPMNVSFGRKKSVVFSSQCSRDRLGNFHELCLGHVLCIP